MPLEALVLDRIARVPGLGDVGDIAYYASWGNLALFYRDFGWSAGLVRLGRLDGGVEILQREGALKARFERVE